MARRFSGGQYDRIQISGRISDQPPTCVGHGRRYFCVRGPVFPKSARKGDGETALSSHAGEHRDIEFNRS
ncbi:hypothetical protein C2E31_12965 [Rhodopirellula baltica]|nr:hypothetical protein C2E31_12965 [Rhodopirellula baltica]